MLYGFSELSGSPIYPKYLQFRHRVFSQIPGYYVPHGPVSSFQAFPRLAERASWASGVEFDSCDVPKTIHLAFVSPLAEHQLDLGDIIPALGGVVTGCIRVLPTDGHFMIRDALDYGLWKGVRLREPIPQGEEIYEASRIAVSRDLKHGTPERKQVVDNLVYGQVELGARLGVERMIGIMHDQVWKAVYISRGIPVQFLSDPFRIDATDPVIIGAIDTDAKMLAALNGRFESSLKAGSLCPAIVDEEILLAHRCNVQLAAERRRKSAPDGPLQN